MLKGEKDINKEYLLYSIESYLRTAHRISVDMKESEDLEELEKLKDEIRLASKMIEQLEEKS